MIALFSGRFDPPNLGHVITIEWLFKKYDKVIICILDYPEREGCDVKIARDIFYTHFFLILPNMLMDRIRIIDNKTHFAEITKDELEFICFINSREGDLGNFVYVGGNNEVNNHIRSLNCIKIDELRRIVLKEYHMCNQYFPENQYMFESTRIREKMAQGESLEEQYNIKGDFERK